MRWHKGATASEIMSLERPSRNRGRGRPVSLSGGWNKSDKADVGDLQIDPAQKRRHAEALCGKGWQEVWGRGSMQRIDSKDRRKTVGGGGIPFGLSSVGGIRRGGNLVGLWTSWSAKGAAAAAEWSDRSQPTCSLIGCRLSISRRPRVLLAAGHSNLTGVYL